MTAALAGLVDYVAAMPYEFSVAARNVLGDTPGMHPVVQDLMVALRRVVVAHQDDALEELSRG